MYSLMSMHRKLRLIGWSLKRKKHSADRACQALTEKNLASKQKRCMCASLQAQRLSGTSQPMPTRLREFMRKREQEKVNSVHCFSRSGSILTTRRQTNTTRTEALLLLYVAIEWK